MSAEDVLEAAVAGLRAAPPPGVDLHTIETFLRRHRPALLKLIGAALAAETGPTGRDGVPTPTGGLRSARALPFEALRVGDRVVTAEGLHGRLEEVTTFVLRDFHGHEIVRPILLVRLDSGRSERPPNGVFAELRRGAPPVRDVLLFGNLWSTPSSAWQLVRTLHDDMHTSADRVRSASTPKARKDWAQAQAKAKTDLVEALRVFRAWRREHPENALPGYDPALDEHIGREVGLNNDGGT